MGDMTWRKSSLSGNNNNCVEIAFQDQNVLIRDSKYTGPTTNQPIIPVPAADWPTLLDLALNRSSGTVNSALTVTVHPDGSAALHTDAVDLSYTPAEWDAFAKGVADGQFTRP